jgi:hypothetical protein
MMKQLMRQYFGFGLLLIICVSACNRNQCDVSATCVTVAPTTADLSLRVTINDENPWLPLAVYYGDVSDSNLYFRDTVNTESLSYVVPIDQRYGVIVKYRKGNQTILAVDGGRTSHSTNYNCDNTCYTVNNLSLGMRLVK